MKALFIVFLIFVGMLAIVGVLGFFGRSFWRPPRLPIRLASVLCGQAAFVIGVYSLAYDFSVAVFALYLFALEVVLTVICEVLAARESGFRWHDVKEEISGVFRKLEFRNLSWRRALETADRKLESDKRPPVLYLRSFARETRRYAMREHFSRVRQNFQILTGVVAGLVKSRGDPEVAQKLLLEAVPRRGVYGPLTAQNVIESWKGGHGRVYDQQLIIANIMNQIGPYIAVARPNEGLTWRGVGAARLEVPEEKWQEVVLGLIKNAAAVVIDAGSSKGLVWELKQVAEFVSPIRILLLLPFSQAEYAGFREHLGDIFPKPLPDNEPPSRLMTFSKDWDSIVLGNQISSLDEVYTVSFSDTLRIFFEQNGFKLQQPR